MSLGCQHTGSLFGGSEMDDLITEQKIKAEIRDYGRYSPVRHNKFVKDYVQQMIMNLNVQKSLRGPIAVASFVEFDDTLQTTHSLGNQIAEAALIEMNQLGYLMADVNLGDTFTINKEGNFVFSRNLDKK